MEHSSDLIFKKKKVIRKHGDLKRSTFIAQKTQIFLPVDSKETKFDDDLNEDNEKTFGKNLHSANSLSF